MKKVILVVVCLFVLIGLVAAGCPFWKAHSIMDQTPVYDAACGQQIATVHFRWEKVHPGFFTCGTSIYVQRFKGGWFNAKDVQVVP